IASRSTSLRPTYPRPWIAPRPTSPPRPARRWPSLTRCWRATSTPMRHATCSQSRRARARRGGAGRRTIIKGRGPSPAAGRGGRGGGGGAGPRSRARSGGQGGRRVGREPALGTADTSVSAVAVAAAHRRLGSLQDRAALLIGAGRVNDVSARALRGAGIGSLTAVRRTPQAAAQLAAPRGGVAGALGDPPRALAAARPGLSAT